MRADVIPVYCFNWHLGQSPAQSEILIDPLSPYIRFDVRAWDGNHLVLSAEKIKATPLVFFLFPPPPNLLSNSDARLIWIPMWDLAKEYSAAWWRKLPKSLRVVAFSEEIRLKAEAVGLQTLIVKYYKNPEAVRPVSWKNKEKTLFYWNRTGLVSKEFLKKICETLEIDMLFFRRRIDPGWPAWCDYVIPQTLGNTTVQELTLSGAEGFSEYLKYLSRANVFIAPRTSEGVGLSFIEAMARGCAVFSCDAPTMNEYIVNKKNGYLLAQTHEDKLGSHGRKSLQRIYGFVFRWKLTGSKVTHPLFRHPVTTRQNWKEIAELDLPKLGDSALRDQLDGHKAWVDSIPHFAGFIADW